MGEGRSQERAFAKAGPEMRHRMNSGGWQEVTTATTREWGCDG